MALSEALGFIFNSSDCTDYKIKSSILMICMYSLGKTLYSLALFPSVLTFLNQILAMNCWA